MWLSTDDLAARWPGWQNFSPYPSELTEAQAWAEILSQDAQAELETLIPVQYQDEAATDPTPSALVAACYALVRSKIKDWFYNATGRGSLEECQALQTLAETIVRRWIEAQVSAEERGGIVMDRIRRKDPFWATDQEEEVADYDLS